MTLRYLVVVLLLSAIGAGLLGMRQQQLNDKHAIAEWHSQMRQDREQIKDLQVRIAERARPEALYEAIDRADLRFEPIAGEGPEQAATNDSEEEAGEEAQSSLAAADDPETPEPPATP